MAQVLVRLLAKDVILKAIADAKATELVVDAYETMFLVQMPESTAEKPISPARSRELVAVLQSLADTDARAQAKVREDAEAKAKAAAAPSP